MFAKWPLTDMIDGAVGWRVLVEGRRGEERAAMTQERRSSTSYRLPSSKLQTQAPSSKSAANELLDARDVVGGD